CAQMEMLESFLADKRQLATEYIDFFKSIDVKFRTELNDTKANYWLMCVELNNIDERNQFLKISNDNGVMTRPIWTLTYRLPMYQHCYRDAQVNAEFLEQRIVNIPSSVR
uniref:DegT/DnrJ/EryC1/StrS family aminotransferase n=1 Tax=Sphingobacterium sp. TaxID=341027 RepID=UPI0028977654